MGHVPLSWYLVLSAILFGTGVAGFVYRKSVITVFMSIELMLNAVNLSFVAFSYQLQRIDGLLGNASFVQKAPADVIERERNKQGELQGKRVQLAERLASLTD